MLNLTPASSLTFSLLISLRTVLPAHIVQDCAATRVTNIANSILGLQIGLAYNLGSSGAVLLSRGLLCCRQRRDEAIPRCHKRLSDLSEM